MKVWHPDFVAHNPDLQRQAEERSKQINNAYDILERYLIDGDIPRPRPRPPTQSQKQESEQRTRQQEAASEDAHSSQTHEEENRQKQTTEPFEEESLAAEIGAVLRFIGTIIRIIFAIIFGVYIGVLIGTLLSSLPLVMIEAVSGWSIIDRMEEEWVIFNFVMLASLIVTVFGRIIDTIWAKRQNRPFIGIHKGWFTYTTIGGCGGTIGGIVCGLSVSIIGNEAVSTRIATFIGAVLGARLACRYAVRRHLKKKK